MHLPVYYDDLLTWRQRRSVREAYIRQQDGICCYCGEPLDKQPSEQVMSREVCYSLFPSNFFLHSIHLHHDHDTGLTIGAVHCYCNAIAWQYEGK